MTEKATEKTAPVVKEDVLELAKKIQTSVKIDNTSGVGTVDGDPYKENLPESLTMETVKEVSKYNTKFVAASAHAFGTLAVDAMAKNKKLEEASIEFSLGSQDSASFKIQREKITVDHLSGSGKEIVKHGVITPKYEVRAGKNAGQLKAVRSTIAALAAEKLK